VERSLVDENAESKLGIEGS